MNGCLWPNADSEVITVSAQKLSIIVFAVCAVFTWIGSEISTGDGSLGSYMYHIFRGLGAVAITGWFVSWYFSPDRE